jgi:probable HAF family extracellular repeat protein
LRINPTFTFRVQSGDTEMNRLLWAEFLFVALLVTTSAAATPPVAAQASSDWQIVDLGTLGGDASYAQAINNRGWVAGFSETADGQLHAFLWRNGVMDDLGTPGFESSAWDINDKGQVVGTRELASGISAGFIWENSSLTKLSRMGGTDTIFYSINNRGDVVGEGTCLRVCAFLISAKKGLLRILDFNGGDSDRSARDINQKGQVVGTRFLDEGLGGFTYPYVWTKRSGFTDLTVGGSWGGATAINNRGQIVGFARDPGLRDRRAFLWTNGVEIELGTLSGGSGTANDINNHGQVVGEDRDQQRALLWRKNGTVIDLGTLGGCCANATGINDRGQITGWSETADGHTHAVLWTK